MARQKKVIDASVIVKWYVQEQGTEASLELREAHIRGDILLLAPDFVVIEVLNALRYKQVKPAFLVEAADDLYNIQIQLQHAATIIPLAVGLAQAHNLSFYDALYAALAELHNCPLLTAGKKLATTPHGRLV